jgi:hypothetical protein
VVDLLSPLIGGEADVVLGSRFLGSMTYRAGVLRRAGMALFGAIVASLTGQRVTDPTSGFQAMNRRALTFFSRENYPSDYPDADALLLLHYAGFRVVEVPVCMHDRLSGASMHSGWRVFYYTVKMLLAILTVLMRRRTLTTPNSERGNVGAGAGLTDRSSLHPALGSPQGANDAGQSGSGP